MSTTTLIWKGRIVPFDSRQTVLEALQAHGISVRSSCRSGLCQTCIVRALEGTPPREAQRGLAPNLAAQGYFLACQARPETPLAIGDASDLPTVTVTVARIERPADTVTRLFLNVPPSAPFPYRPGQFVHMIRNDGLTRSYSLASVPGDPYLEFHIKQLTGGAMSSYIYESLVEGDTLTIRGPLGNTFYQDDRPDQPLLLAGTGTGLAPLLGVTRDALAQGHKGPIELHHGARDMHGLYAHEELERLERDHDNFTYVPCVLDEWVKPPLQGNLRERVLSRVQDWVAQKETSPRVFMCGSPAFVPAMKRNVFLAGVSLKDIFTDAFVTAPTPG